MCKLLEPSVCAVPAAPIVLTLPSAAARCPLEHLPIDGSLGVSHGGPICNTSTSRFLKFVRLPAACVQASVYAASTLLAAVSTLLYV
jgi:hypothetical protein